MKNCNRCKKSLPLTDFSKNKSKRDGLQGSCKLCVREYDKQRYHNCEEIRKSRIQTNKKTRLKIKECLYGYLIENPCVDCGNINPVVLEFDHVRGEKSFNLSEAPFRGFSIKRVEEEIKKCDVRCANCHRIKTAEQLGWTK